MLTAVRVKRAISNVVIPAVGLGTVSCVRVARRQFPRGAGASRLACIEIIQSGAAPVTGSRGVTAHAEPRHRAPGRHQRRIGAAVRVQAGKPKVY